jgi:hypothetical protein
VQLASKTYPAHDIAAVQELYHSNGWADGLPIVPPTRDAVEACLEWAMTPPDQLLGIEPKAIAFGMSAGFAVSGGLRWG